MTFADAWNVVAAGAASIGITALGIWTCAHFFAERIADRWLKGVEAKHAKELAHVSSELDRLNRHVQARLDHAVSVSRAQFEFEFVVLREIWKFVARVRAAVVGIVPVSVPEDQTDPQKLDAFFAARNKFSEAHRKLTLAVDNNSAFYPEAIFRAVDALLKRSAMEVLYLSVEQPPFTSDWYDRRAKAVADINAGADVVSAAIRTRLESIAIRE